MDKLLSYVKNLFQQSSSTTQTAPQPIQATSIRPKEYVVLEVAQASPGHELDKETQAAIASLAGNPGFEALMEKLKLQRAMLESRLRTDHFKRLEDVFSLQAGIFWLDWLRRQVAQETNRVEPEPMRRPFEIEESELLKVQQALTLIGMDPVQVP